MAVATDTTCTPVIPFPIERTRKPDQVHRAIDEWNRTRNTALAACAFRGKNDGDADATVREIIVEGGAEAVAFMLEESGRAIKSMQHIVDELTAVVALIASAADRVLTEAGL